MNVPADLAEKILQAGLRNVAADVGDGSTLNAQQREMLMMFAMNPEIAKRLRAYELVKRHCRCEELTAEQWEEVRAIYPEFTPGDAAPEPPEEIRQVFALSPEPARKKLTREYLEDLGKRYGRTPRQIRRWHDEGAPIDDAIKFADWWEQEKAAGRKTWSLPEGIALAADAARAAIPPPPAPEVIAARLSDGTPPPPPPSEGAPAPPKGAPINLEDYDPQEGGMLRELKQLRQARWDEIRKKLNAGEDVTSLEGKAVKLEDMISRIEARIEERLKKQGLYLPFAVVQREIFRAVEMVKQMGESEARRIIELCPALTSEMKDQVELAVKAIADARAQIFRNLKMTKGNGLRNLAAA